MTLRLCRDAIEDRWGVIDIEVGDLPGQEAAEVVCWCANHFEAYRIIDALEKQEAASTPLNDEQIF